MNDADPFNKHPSPAFLMNIEIIDPDPDIDISVFKSLIISVFKGEDKPASFINVIFMGKDQLRELKHQYFNLDVYTDVISFNLNDPGAEIEGELYLSFDQIQENAQEYATSVLEEVHRVLIHGCLHLCGYEDDTPGRKQKMTTLEDHYLAGIKGAIS